MCWWERSLYYSCRPARDARVPKCSLIPRRNEDGSLFFGANLLRTAAFEVFGWEEEKPSRSEKARARSKIGSADMSLDASKTQ